MEPHSTLVEENAITQTSEAIPNLEMPNEGSRLCEIFVGKYIPALREP